MAVNEPYDTETEMRRRRWNDGIETRAGGGTPTLPDRGEGGSRMLRGPHVTYGHFFLFFNVFKIFVNIFVHNEVYR